MSFGVLFHLCGTLARAISARPYAGVLSASRRLLWLALLAPLATAVLPTERAAAGITCPDLPGQSARVFADASGPGCSQSFGAPINGTVITNLELNPTTYQIQIVPYVNGIPRGTNPNCIGIGCVFVTPNYAACSYTLSDCNITFSYTDNNGATVNGTAKYTRGSTAVTDITLAGGSFDVYADLAITKTNGVSTVTPGGNVTYTILVTNSGSNVSGATVTDIFPAVLTGSWTCVGYGGATCTASGSGDINDTVDLPATSSVVYTVNATISPSATGTLSNTATVAVPGGVIDPDPSNNSATDTDTVTVQADLSITKTSGVPHVVPGGNVTYTITATNNGPGNVALATVVDNFPAALLNAAWTCVGVNGGACAASGNGSISDLVDLASGGSVIYTVNATVSPSATGTLSNTATIHEPVGVVDAVQGNNSATAIDVIMTYPTTTAVTSSLNPSHFGENVTLTATVTPSVTATPTGTVTFRDGGTVLGSAPVTGGQAAFDTSTLSPGGHRLTASYSGDSGAQPSTSIAFVQTVLLPCSDAFGNATELPGSVGTASGTTVGTTGEPGEPDHAGVSAPLNSVWCKWTAPISQSVTFDTAGSNFDTTLAVYTGSSLGGLTPVKANDNIAPDTVQSRVTFDATQGTTYYVALDGAGAATGSYLLTVVQRPGAPSLVAAVLPSARSVQTQEFATAFATVINSGGSDATSCSISIPPAYPALFTYQTTDASNQLTGTPNTSVDIPANDMRHFVFGLVPTVEISSAEVPIQFSCTNTGPAASVFGLTTLGLSSSASAPADIVATSATASGDGIVTVPLAGQGAAAFAAAGINIGAAVDITAVVDDNTRNLPLTITLCRTDLTGGCMEPPGAGPLPSLPLGQNEVATYSVFIEATEPVPFDPAVNRLFVRFKTPDGVTRGATSVAVRTAAAADQRADLKQQ